MNTPGLGLFLGEYLGFYQCVFSSSHPADEFFLD